MKITVHFFTISLLLFLVLPVLGQQKLVSGVIVDHESKETLAFVQILSPGSQDSTYTNFDGRFEISLPSEIKKLRIYHPHYHVSTVDISDNRSWFIFQIKQINPTDTADDKNPNLKTQNKIYQDSLALVSYYQRKSKQLERISSGNISWGIFDIPFDKFVGYNSYEGLWAGAGIRTNSLLSKKWNIGGYGGYSFRAKNPKYGIDANITLYKPWSLNLRGSYSKDYIEAAGIYFLDKKLSVFDEDHFKDYFISRANYSLSKEIDLGFKIFQHLNVNIGLRTENKKAAYNYYFKAHNDYTKNINSEFNFTEVKLLMRYDLNNYTSNKKNHTNQNSKYPIIWFNYIKGVSGFLNGEYDYQRFDLKIQKGFNLSNLGFTNIIFTGGIILGDIPYSNLYRGQGSNGVVTIFAPNSFGSMGAAEFLSDQYFSTYLSHHFGALLPQRKFFNPEFVLLTNIGYGWLAYPNSHYNIEFKTMELGYFESGFLINKILDLKLYHIGIGATYRYGAYSNPLFIDNLSIKISLSFSNY